MAIFEDFTAGKGRFTHDVTLDADLSVAGEITITPSDTAPTGSTLGTAAAGTIAAVHELGGIVNRSTFTLTGASIPVTDDGASGSFGTLNLFTFPAGGIAFLGSRQDYTAFAEGAALTGAAGDAAFEIGLGTVAIAAVADGALAATNDDIGGDVNVTLSEGTGTGTGFTGAGVVFDGTTTAATLNLNWSGSAATIDANSTITVTGTITVLWSSLGDD
jgi:hypothetical protein